MRMLDRLRVEPIPGDGLLARRPGRLLIVFDFPTAPWIGRMLRSFEATEGEGSVLIKRMALVVIDMPEEEEIGAFCLVADSDRGLTVMVHGDVMVRDGSDVVLFDGNSSPTWVDGYLESPDLPLKIGTTGISTYARGPWDLDIGVVPAGAVILSSDIPIQAHQPAEESTPLPRSSVDLERHEAVDEGDIAFELIDLTTSGPFPELAPLAYDVIDSTDGLAEEEIVTGVSCSRGHFNHPEVLFCAHCGIKMVHVTKTPTKGSRPPLGLLVLDDGSTFALDQGYLVGREPQIDDLVGNGVVRPLTVNDSSNSVSRVHAEIRLDGWRVEAVDRDSSNGTFLHVGDGRWRRLEPGRPHALHPGNELSVGERRFVFESNVLPRET